LRAEVSRGSRSSDRERGCETGRRWFAGPVETITRQQEWPTSPRHSPVDDVVVQVQQLLSAAYSAPEWPKLSGFLPLIKSDHSRVV
jgi:hypothetical protein